MGGGGEREGEWGKGGFREEGTERGRERVAKQIRIGNRYKSKCII